MKKIYNQLKSCVALVAFALLFGVNAQAQTIDNPTVLELNKEYSGKMFEDHFFVFKAETNGKLICTGSEAPDFYLDAAYEEADPDYTFSYVSGGKETQRDVVAGNTYYLCIRNQFTWNFTARMGDSSTINLESCTPEQNTYYNVAVGQLVLIFDAPVAYDSALLQAGTAAVEVSGFAYGKDLSFEIKSQLFEWLSSGVLKKDDTFTLTISGVRSATNPDALYNGDGVLVLTFLAPNKPAELVKATVPEVFYSYWAPGSQDGVIVLEYDAEISTEPMPQATISFGSAETEGDFYSENIPVVVEGKTLTMNLCGKKRIPAEMVASGLDYGFFNVRINNIRDTYGEYVYTDGQGSYGSYQSRIPYELLSVNLTTEFLPASGSSLAGVNSVELWLSTDKAVSFEGVEVNYKKASGENDCVIYTKEECNYVNEGEDGVILTIPITAEMQNGTNVKITLYQEQSLDGEVRTIEAIYNVVELLEPTTITPAPLSQVESLATITFAYDEAVTLADGSVAYLLSGNGRSEICKVAMKAEGNNIVLTPEMQELEAGGYILNVPEGLISNAGGKKNEAMYLKYELVKPYELNFSFDPEDGAEVSELSKITISNPGGLQISWNYAAQLYKEGDGAPIATTTIEEIVNPDDYFALATQAVFTLKDIANPTEDIVITTPGKYRLEIPAGYFINGDGSSNEDCPAITVNWTIVESEDPFALVFTPANGAVVESLSKIIVDCAGGFGPSNVEERKAKVYDAENNVVATVKKNDTPSDFIDKETYLPKRVILYLDKEIKTSGEYTLKIDKGYFYVNGWDMVDSEPYEIHFTVYNPSDGVEGIFGSEAEAYEVYNLSGVKVLSTKNAAELGNLPAGFYVINGKTVYLRK